MVNLTVEVVHTFAVGDGAWVVHNCDVSVTRDFAHASSLEHIDNIMKHGLNEDSALEASKRGLVNRPGSFFTVEVTPDTLNEVVDDLLFFGSRHAPDDKAAILIMKMPQDMFDELLSNASVLSRPIAGAEELTEVIFLPKSFTVINQGVGNHQVTWQLIDPFRNQR